MNKKLYLIAVHGTFAGPVKNPDADHHKEFYNRNSGFASELKQSLEQNEWNLIDWLSFTWSGENLESHRIENIPKLASFIEEHCEDQSAEILIIAHSHGGNIALDTVVSMTQRENISLVTCGTPFSHCEPVSLKDLLPITVGTLCAATLAAGFGVFAVAHVVQEPYFTPAIFLVLLTAYSVASIFFLKLVRDRNTILKSRNKFCPEQPKVLLISHPDDEAISLLNSETCVNVPNGIFLKSAERLFLPIAFTLTIMFLAFFIIPQNWVMPDILPGFENLPFGLRQAAVIAAWTFMVVAAVGSVFLVPMSFLLIAFEKKLGNVLSVILSKLLWNMALGNDDIHKVTMSNRPQISKSAYIVLNHENSNVYTAFSNMSASANQRLAENKVQIIKGIMESKGDVFRAAFSQTGINILDQEQKIVHPSKALVHCNYFTRELANLIAEKFEELLVIK